MDALLAQAASHCDLRSDFHVLVDLLRQRVERLYSKPVEATHTGKKKTGR